MTKIWWRGTIKTVLLVLSFTWKSTFWQVTLCSMGITSETMNKSVNECSIIYKSCTARQCLYFPVCLARSHNSSSDSFWQHNLRRIKVLLELTWEISVNVRETRCSRFSAGSALICHGTERLLSVRWTLFIILVYWQVVPDACRVRHTNALWSVQPPPHRLYFWVVVSSCEPVEALHCEISFHALCVYWFYWVFRKNQLRYCQRAKSALRPTCLQLDIVLEVEFILHVVYYLCS